MQGSRVFGLDVMRATAILLVVFWHCIGALGEFVELRWLPPYVDGVDLFFVLSGYLIGGILLRYAAMGEVPWWRRLLDFWQRRWLRTLPNYYLFLVVNVVLVTLGISGGMLNNVAWGYVLFLQNLWQPVELFFWESWSLVVEEWFYLLFPVVLFAVLPLLRTRTAFLFATVLFIVAPMLVRWSSAEVITSTFQLELSARKLATTRMDTIGFGMLAALLHASFPSGWRRVRWPLCAIGIIAVLFNASGYGNGTLHYASTWFFTVNAIAMAMLLPLLSTWTNVPRGGAVIAFVSSISYALYLVHQPVRYFWNPWFAAAEPAQGVLLWIAYWVACIAIAWLVHRFWEKPFMLLRDRLGRRVLGTALTPSS
ncbi:MAG TPA: acyltransferase [Flavobacteriales bacterium]|nr:acyltransferase [Flavobacteriales bacterium]